MLLSLFFLLIALIGGTLLTYLYSPGMPLAVRLCTGTCTGLALFAMIGFIAASLFGMTPSALWLPTFLLSLPWLLLATKYKFEITREISECVHSIRTAASTRSRVAIGYIAFYAAVAVALGVLFSYVVFQRADGIYTGLVNDLGDLPFHIQIISSFAYGNNFPPQDPAFAGVHFAYPFLSDFLTAQLVWAGAPMFPAMWIQTFALSMALVGLVHYWTVKTTGDRLAGVIAPVLILLSGGLGWTMLFNDVSAPGAGLFSVLTHLPHDYTIMPESIYRWGNSLTTLFIPQRSILFGLPLAVVIFTQWWLALQPTSTVEPQPELDVLPAEKKVGKNRAASKAVAFANSARSSAVLIAEPVATLEASSLAEDSVKRMIAAGLFAGMLPLIHAHTFLVVMGMAVCVALLFRNWKSWIAFFAAATVIGLPTGLWSTHDSAVQTHSFLGLFLGWDRGSANPVWFWFQNTGFFIPLLIAAIYWRRQGKDLVSTRLLKFYLPFLFCFIVPNLIKLAPWGWDNIKVLFYWYVASAPLVALLLASWFKGTKGPKLAASILLASLTLAGALDILRVITGSTSYREFANDEISIASAIRNVTEPRALVLSAPTYNPAVYLTGRRTLLGYTGTIWSRGLDYGQRETDLNSIYAGAPDAMSLLQGYHINYVVVGPPERSTLHVNDAFWNHFPVVATAGEYRLYKIEPLK